ncbi:oligopeptidase A [Rhodnius prolixus]|uniref:Putative oligopeptidase n=1 Tax=Rhodnius neglectus TaxID=72488 RepID=A0A0P4VSG5_9HEMI
MAISILGRRLRLHKPQRLFQQIRTGYIVLLPETGPEQLEQNPLYKNGLPDIENITQEKCVTTLGKYLLDFEHGVRLVENDIVEKENELELFDDIVDPVEECGTKLESTWGLVKALYIADKKKMPSESYLSLHERARRARSLKYNSRHIYNFFKNYDVSKLTEEEQRVVSKFLVEGKLNGLNLDGNNQETFAEILVNLASETSKFSQRVKVSSQNYSHVISDPLITREFPEDLLQAMSLSKDPYKGPWKISLKILDKFLQHCPDRNLRWNAWLASRQVASFEGPRELNNSQYLEKIRLLRRDMAKVLGYGSFAEMSMETKMAGTVENIQNTLGKILEIARPYQENELNSLQSFAEERGFDGTLELWDIPFWERKQKISMYHWDDQKMKEFFPYEKVLNGLLKTVSNCFNLKIEEAADITTWHPDCKVYKIYELDNAKPVAIIYLDPFRRDSKLFTEVGQVISMRPKARALGPSPPIAALILNLPAPQSSKLPSLLTLKDVTMLFSKFGEALQQVLSAVNYLEVSGLNNVEWDAVHIVSNFMSLLLTDPEVVKEISGHYNTKETIPVSNLSPILEHMPGFHVCNEIYLANLDIHLHTSKEFWLGVTKRLWPEHFCLPLHKYDAHPLSFTTSISQGMSCAVYSKLWSKILATDAFNTFKTDPDPKVIGDRFRDTFLAFGGSCHPSEVFRRFQGRDPTPEAFIATTFPDSAE